MGRHGSLVEVGGLGVLLLGGSGVGKSECALELVRRGNRLVADDVVEIERNASGDPVGRASAKLGHHMEIRGLGILSIPDLFGEDAVTESVRIDLVCRLEGGRDDYDRVGIERPTLDLDGADVPCVTLPAHPAGTIATLVEVAVRDLDLRRSGRNGALRFDERLRDAMGGD